MPLDERLLIGDAAAVLEIDPSTLRRWELTKPDFPRPPRVRRNNQRFYRPSDLERIRQWMEAVDEPVEIQRKSLNPRRRK